MRTKQQNGILHEASWLRYAEKSTLGLLQVVIKLWYRGPVRCKKELIYVQTKVRG